MKYPFLPKSNIKIELGEYWNLPLSNGYNAFFMVIDIPTKENRTGIFVRMLEEMSRDVQLDRNKEYTKILWQSSVHIKTIKECGGLIQGKIRPILPIEELDSSGGKYCQVMRGYSVVRTATKKDIANMEVQTSSGYNVARIIAEKQWIQR